MIPQYAKNKEKGYIVESGSNENGNYIKFNDGTMICKGDFTIPENTSMYYLDFPIQFISNKYEISLTNIFFNSPDIIYSIGNNEENRISIYPRSISGESTTPNCTTKGKYIAIGKWK